MLLLNILVVSYIGYLNPLVSRGGEANCSRKKGECNSYVLEKGGLCLKVIAIIFQSSPCGFLYHFDLSQKEKKSKKGIKLLHANFFDLGEERPDQQAPQKAIPGQAEM